MPGVLRPDLAILSYIWHVVCRARLRKFPSLVNCCTIDWFSEWPADALKSVASQFLKVSFCLFMLQHVLTAQACTLLRTLSCPSLVLSCQLH